MYKLIFADDTECTVGLCGSYDDGPLYIEVYGLSFVECAQIFSDPEKTARMTYDYTIDQNVFEGYTELASLALAGDVINVTMKAVKA